MEWTVSPRHCFPMTMFLSRDSLRKRSRDFPTAPQLHNADFMNPFPLLLSRNKKSQLLSIYA